MVTRAEQQKFVVQNDQGHFFEIVRYSFPNADTIESDEFKIVQLTGLQEPNSHFAQAYRYGEFQNWCKSYLGIHLPHDLSENSSENPAKDLAENSKRLLTQLSSINFRQFSDLNVTQMNWQELLIDGLIIDNILGAAYLKDAFPFDEFYFSCQITALKDNSRISPYNDGDHYQCRYPEKVKGYRQSQRENSFVFKTNLDGEKKATKALEKKLTSEINQIDQSLKFLEILTQNDPDLIKKLATANANPSRTHDLSRKYGDLYHHIDRAYKILIALQPFFIDLDHDELHYQAYRRLPIAETRSIELRDLGERFRKLFH